MNIQDAYREVEYRLNKLGSNAGQRIPLPQFVSAMNKAQTQWAEARVRVAEKSGIVTDELQLLLKTVTGQGINKGDRYEVNLPDDYFHLSRAWSTTDCGPLYIKRTEAGNLNALLSDPLSAPSKEWEETLGTLSESKLSVWTAAPGSTGFKMGDISVAYFRLPRPVDISGYVNGNVPSQDSDLEFDGASAYEIIDLTCLILASDTGDQARYQTLTQFVQSNP